MTVWALVPDTVVLELTNVNPTGRYSPEMPWIDCTSTPAVAPGWIYSGGIFLPPPGVTVVQALASLASLLEETESLGVSYQASSASSASFYDTSSVGQGRLGGALLAVTQGQWVSGTPLRTVDNLYISMTSADVVALATKAFNYIALCGVNAQRLAGLVQADPLTSIQSGWPSNL